MGRQFAWLLVLAACLIGGPSLAAPPTEIDELHRPAVVTRDDDGIPHIRATNEHDLMVMQGWVHARDRLFQMDVLRRTASGTLAELVGSAALPSDVEFRTIGLRRAAEASLDAVSQKARDALEAYADGVNAFVQDNPLPVEYGLLELTTFEPWTAVDCLAIGKLIAADLSFDLSDIERTDALLTYRGALGDPAGTALFFEDTHRSAPFDPAATIPDANMVSLAAEAAPAPLLAAGVSAAEEVTLAPEILDLAQDYVARVEDIPFFRKALDPDNGGGSNAWVVSGALTAKGRPLIANDPHLALNTPALFYPIHLRALPAGFDVIGESLPGTPYVILGQNRRIAWGATNHRMDVVDIYQEQVVPDGSSPSGLSTLYNGTPEPIIPMPEVFRTNVFDGTADNLTVVPPGGAIPAATLIVPRRNNGPIIQLDLVSGVALSVQYTGASGTREADTSRALNLARNLGDFIAGLQTLDVGSQNWSYADVFGNIAYIASGELPLREDLQAGTVTGLPPFFIRNGTGGNEWLPMASPGPNQAVPFEILPFDEMPQIVNPPAGFVVNANNDPLGLTLDNDPLNQLRPGGGILYFAPRFSFATRAGRIRDALEERLAADQLDREDMLAIQADVVMPDAEVFTPLILAAFGNATAGGADPVLAALGADPRIVEAAGRLSAWDYAAPTGIEEGFDASDVDGARVPPTTEEMDASVAATIYSVWRGQMIMNTIDATLAGLPLPDSEQAMTALRNLLDNFDDDHGVGASGLDFFVVPGVANPADRRDVLILQSLADALDLLAGPAFDMAFGGSTDQDDYLWGRLHRLTLAHPLDDVFSAPPAGGAFPPPLADLPGIPVDGGFGVVDRSTHDVRAASDDAFQFDAGPVRRYVGEFRRGRRIMGESSLPGGTSGVIGSPFYVNLLGPWLTNETYAVRQRVGEFARHAVERMLFVPGRPGGFPPF